MGGSDEGDIHGFRVTIKKLKGVIKLMGLLVDDFSAKDQFAPLKELFKPAGEMRECQVNLKRLKEFTGSDAFYQVYKKARKKCMKSHRAEFDKALVNFDLELLKETGREIKRQCKVLNRQSIYVNSIAFIKRRLKAIDKHYQRSDADTEEVHEIRIQLKEISVVLGLFHHIQPKVITEEVLLKLKEYESEIGKWHDLAVLQASIDEFCVQFPNDIKGLTEDIQKLKSEISIEEKRFLDQLDLFVMELKEQINNSVQYLNKKSKKIQALPNI